MQAVGGGCLRRVKPSNGNLTRATHVTCTRQNHPYSFGVQDENGLTPPNSSSWVSPTVLFLSSQSHSSPSTLFEQSQHSVMLSCSAQLLSSPKERFVSLLAAQELEQQCKPYVPRKTRNNSSWAAGVFRTWAVARNSLPGLQATDAVPVNILEIHYPLHVIDGTLAAFVFKARKANGKLCPGSTIKNILAVLHRVMKVQLGASNVMNFVN